MDYICGFVQIFALFLTTLWFFTWLCERRNETDWVFMLKRQLAVYWVSRKKRRQAILSNTMNAPIDGTQERKYDSNIVNYYGVDQKNNFIFIKINRRKEKQAELTLFLGFEDGRTYELPDHPNTVVSDLGNSDWSGTGLKISILESSRRARIIFNGLLRKGNRTDINCETDDDIEHVRFNCIFVMSTRPYPREEFWSSELQSEALVRNSWKKSKWQQLINNLELDQIDQYGSILGQVITENSSITELYLHALRQCHWGKCDAARFERNICITGIDAIGNSFHVTLGDLTDGLKSMQLGHVKYPFDFLDPVNSLSFDIKQFMDRYESGFNEYTFQFTAGTKTYNAIIKLRRKSLRILYGGYPWDSQYVYCNFELKLNNTPGVGMVQLWQPYSGSCPIKLRPIERFIGTKEFGKDPQAYTFPFQDKRCQNESLVGGKGASLAELSSIKTTQFTVPEGFCVTAHAWETHIKYHTSLAQAIDEFVKVCTGEQAGDLTEYSQKVETLIKITPILHTVQTEIFNALKQLEVDGQKNTYAVRSSAVGEDSEDTSAAGQNSTYLGIKSTNEVMKYVAYCWASLYTHQSIEYRRQHGMPIKASMGVCVQKMVDAAAAGVMFTRHPITGNPKEIFITSNYGLGESVVSALVDPDTIIVERSRSDSLTVKTSTIGKKSQKVTVNSDGSGTLHHSLSDQEKSKLSISPELALKLAEIGVTLDRLYNAPRDVEWAISKNGIHLLQCRPVTALDAWTDFELTHELGSGVPCDNDILTFANVGEVFPMVITPLTLSTIIHGLNISTEANLLKKPITTSYTHYMFIANMRCTLNYMNLFLRYVGKEISLVTRVTEIAVCGHSILTPEIHEAAKRRNGELNFREHFHVVRDMLHGLWHNAAAVETAQKVLKRCRELKVVKRLDEFYSAAELYRAVDDMSKNVVTVSNSHNHTSKSSVSYQVLIMSILAEGRGDLTPEHYSDIAVLLGSCSDVISAQVPLALKEITRTIKESGLGEQFKAVDLPEVMNWLLSNCPKAYEQVREFMATHGHRGVEEFELITETWDMRPEKFLATIQSMINSEDDVSSSTKCLSAAETVAQLKTPRNGSTRWLLRLLLPATRKAVARRETTKALMIEKVHQLRKAYRRLAVLLTREARLPDEGLVFFLTHAELAELVGSPSPALVRKAARRRKIRPRLQSYSYSEINYGLPKPIEKTKIVAAVGEGIQVQGTSVCNGVATGRACVALTLEEASDIKPGDVLITHATDIGWSPYFPLLSGVVTELGGLISHGAVVAREYGLPCIVGVENATRIFKTDEIVTLNGYAGTIEVSKEVVKEDC